MVKLCVLYANMIWKRHHNRKYLNIRIAFGIVKMVSSACDVLLTEPDRFIDYIVSNPKLRKQIVNEETFGEALEVALKSDPTLAYIPEQIKKKGESFSDCGKNIFNMSSIKKLVNQNISSRRTEMKRRVRKQKPNLSKNAFNKEVERRLRISIGQTKPKRLKQITIDEATKPVRVKSYVRNGIKVKGKRRTKPRPLVEAEKRWMLKWINKGLLPQQIIDKYYLSGYDFRTKESIRKYYYRLKNKK